jgi:hypothetical protein
MEDSEGKFDPDEAGSNLDNICRGEVILSFIRVNNSLR